MRYGEAIKDTITYNLKMPKTFINFLRRLALDISEEEERKVTHADISREVLLKYFDKDYRQYLREKD